MGHAKELLAGIQQRGYGQGDGQAVCLACIHDDGLRSEAAGNLSESQCTFCGAKGSDEDDLIAIEIEDLLELVMTGIGFMYDRDSDVGLPREDGDYIDPVLDTDDVVDNCCWGAVTDDVLDAIKGIVSPDTWIESDYQVLRPDRAMRRGWNEFAEHVKHTSRFVFLSVPEDSSFMPDEFTTAEFLENLVDAIRESDALVEVDPGREFWRGRLLTAPTPPPTYTAATLGSPPLRKASANRMSPAGISMFYGSDDPATAVAEIAAHDTKRREYAGVGAFETVKPLTLLNLVDLPDVPSIFTQGGRKTYYPIRILHDFATALAQPVVLDGREHIDYVPTQVVTEYLRWIPVFAIDGILFPSSQRAGTSSVIFCGPNGCADPGAFTKDTLLAFKPASVKVITVASVKPAV